MHLIIQPNGCVRCLYGEQLDLRSLGQLTIERGSHVEPNSHGQWMADLSPVGGPLLGPFDLRTEALTAEVHWLEAHWLTAVSVNTIP